MNNMLTDLEMGILLGMSVVSLLISAALLRQTQLSVKAQAAAYRLPASTYVFIAIMSLEFIGATFNFAILLRAYLGGIDVAFIQMYFFTR